MEHVERKMPLWLSVHPLDVESVLCQGPAHGAPSGRTKGPMLNPSA